MNRNQSLSKLSIRSSNPSEDNYFIVNNIKEQIELKNIVQTKGIFIFKQRFGVLTTRRLLIFETKDKFLSKKTPRKSYILTDYDFTSDGKVLNIYEGMLNLKKKIYFPNSVLCVHWWETIKHFKANLEVNLEEGVEERYSEESESSISEKKDVDDVLMEGIQRRKMTDLRAFEDSNKFDFSATISELSTIHNNLHKNDKSNDTLNKNNKNGSLPSLPSMSSSCFEILQGLNIDYKLEKFEHMIESKTNKEIKNQNENFQIYNNNTYINSSNIERSYHSDSSITSSPFTKSSPHKIPFALNAQENSHFEIKEFQDHMARTTDGCNISHNYINIEKSLNFSKVKTTHNIKSEPEVYLPTDDGNFCLSPLKDEKSLRQINVLTNKTSQNYFKENEYEYLLKRQIERDRIFKIINRDFNEKLNVSQENRNKIYIKNTAKNISKNSIFNNQDYKENEVPLRVKTGLKKIPIRENKKSCKNLHKFNIDKSQIKTPKCLIRRYDDECEFLNSTSSLKEKNTIQISSSIINPNSFNKIPKVENFIKSSRSVLNDSSIPSTVEIEEKSLVQVTLDNCYNTISMTQIIQKGLNSSGISDKIVSLLITLIKNTYNCSNLVNKFLQKFPNLLRRSLYKYNSDLFILTTLSRKKYIASKSQVNPQIINIVLKDISNILSSIVEFLSIISNNSSFRYLKKFTCEMICLKALIYSKIFLN